jgi:mediator of replication checkpoint protein 1
LEEDDANLEKYHRDAVEGKFRSKRRNRGIDFEDSDSELDDDEAREQRRRMAKKRKIEGDTLPELGLCLF